MYVGFNAAVGYDGNTGYTLRIDLSTAHSLLLMAQVGHDTLAMTTKWKITPISFLPPSRVLWSFYR